MFQAPIPEPTRRGRVDPGVAFQGNQEKPEIKAGDEAEEKVHVYVDHQRVSKGDISRMLPNWTLYDLIFEDTADAERLRRQFHDWAIPPHIAFRDGEGHDVRRIKASATFYRGKVTESSYRPEQHIYVILNNLMEPIREFGNPDGAPVSKMNILVAVFIGDIRLNGFLSNARIEYACRLNEPWTKWCRVASRIMDETTGKPMTYYDVVGDEKLGMDLTEKWFRNQADPYYFNRVIYPVSQNGETGY